MTLLARVIDRTKATLHDWMERIEESASTASDTLTKLEREMDSLERTAAATIGTERELLGRLEDASFMSAELGIRATRAAEEGRDYMAKQMMEEKRHYDEIALEMRVRYQDARERAQQLVEKLYELKEQAFQLRKQREREQSLQIRQPYDASGAAGERAAAIEYTADARRQPSAAPHS